MSFIDDLNNAQENKIKREKEEKGKLEEKLDECLIEAYEELKKEMIKEAEKGRRSIDYPLYIYSIKTFQVPIKEEDRVPKTAGQWITKNFGQESLVFEPPKAEYVYSPLFSLDIIQKIEKMLANFLEEDGITDVSFMEIGLVYTDGEKRWYERSKAPVSAYVLYEPKFLVSIKW